MKVLTIGSATIDTIATIDSTRIERMTMRNADFRSYCWRRVARRKLKKCRPIPAEAPAAVAMARLGMDVMILAKIGNDERGEMILQRLEQEGVSTSLVKRDPHAPTGTSVLISSHDRDAAIFTFRGANTLLKPEDLQDEAFDADLIYVANLSNESADCFPLIVDRAKNTTLSWPQIPVRDSFLLEAKRFSSASRRSIS